MVGLNSSSFFGTDINLSPPAGNQGIAGSLDLKGSYSTSSRSPDEFRWWREEEDRIYAQWSSTFSDYNFVTGDIRENPYFDYFFSGQDVVVSIEAGSDLPIYSFGYQVQQEKMPLYGYASYTYDAVLRGTRIISGAFSLITSDHQALHRAISNSAVHRDNDLAYTTAKDRITPLRNVDDEENISKYWNYNYDSNLDPDQRHLFSIHPPFNISIKYGVQETSIIEDVDLRVDQVAERYNDPNKQPLWSDINERLVKRRPDYDTRIILENVEIISKSTQFDPSGEPVLETYAFMARDERIKKFKV